MTMRKVKGMLVFIAFISIAFALLLEPEKGVMGYLQDQHISVNLVASLFVASAIVNLLISWSEGHWNIAGFAILYAYTTMQWIAIWGNYDIPIVSAVSNTFLCVVLTLNAVEAEWES